MTEPRWVAIVNPELMLALCDIGMNDEKVAHRFWAKVDKRTTDDDECWIWTAALSSEGYGNFSVRIDGKERTVRAHRMAWFLTYPQPLDADMYLDHLFPICAGRYCVNPMHLDPIPKRLNDERATGTTSASTQRAKRSEHLERRDLEMQVARATVGA